MNDIDNQKNLIEIKEIYLIIKSDLNKVFDELSDYNKISELNSKKVGIYKHIKKLLPCFDILLIVSDLGSIQSLFTLLRMIVDNYAILNLLTSYSTQDEQLLRYYLYLLDAVHSRSKILLNRSSEILEDSKSETDYAIKNDKLAFDIIRRIITEKKLDQLVNKTIIDNRNWKFKDCMSSDKYKNNLSWRELYILSKIPTSDAEVFQNYYSAFVHGLGVSLMLRDSDDLTIHIAYTLEVCNIIQSLIIKIIIQEFEEETKLVNCSKEVIRYSEKMGWSQNSASLAKRNLC